MSTIQKSASFPIDRLPLLIFKILAGLFVKALIIVSNFKDPLEGLIGMEGVLVEAIDNQKGTGKVKINADVWNVRSCEVEVSVGKKVKVVAVSGNQVDVEESIDFQDYLEKDFDRRLNE